MLLVRSGIFPMDVSSFFRIKLMPNLNEKKLSRRFKDSCSHEEVNIKRQAAACRQTV